MWLPDRLNVCRSSGRVAILAAAVEVIAKRERFADGQDVGSGLLKGIPPFLHATGIGQEPARILLKTQHFGPLVRATARGVENFEDRLVCSLFRDSGFGDRRPQLLGPLFFA